MAIERRANPEAEKPARRKKRPQAVLQSLIPRPISMPGAQARYLNIYEALRRGIIAGGIEPGQILTNRSIAAYLGVSTTPVRDALRRLAADGVLQALPKSAFIAPPISAARFNDILEIRVLLERFATSRAATRIDAASLRKLQLINAQYSNKSLSQDEKLRANREFHFEIYRLAGMADIIDSIELLWVRIGPLLNFTVTPADQMAGVRHHSDILAALKARDPDAAARAIEADLRHAGACIAENLTRSAPPATA